MRNFPSIHAPPLRAYAFRAPTRGARAWGYSQQLCAAAALRSLAAAQGESE